jgi:hypothetical protein
MQLPKAFRGLWGCAGAGRRQGANGRILLDSRERQPRKTALKPRIECNGGVIDRAKAKGCSWRKLTCASHSQALLFIPSWSGRGCFRVICKKSEPGGDRLREATAKVSICNIIFSAAVVRTAMVDFDSEVVVTISSCISGTLGHALWAARSPTWRASQLNFMLHAK